MQAVVIASRLRAHLSRGRWILLGALLATLGSTGCTDGVSSVKGPAKGAPMEARQVQTATVTMSATERTVEVVGSLAPIDRTILSSKVSGRVEFIGTDLGGRVKAGDVLARIEPRDYELRLNQSEALLTQARVRAGLPGDGTNDDIALEKTSTVRQVQAVLDEAKANRDRVKKLSEQGIISPAELDTADSAFEVAASRLQESLDEARNRLALVAQRRAEVEIARQQMKDTAIVAPYDGAIQERSANLGEYLTAGSPVLTLVRMNPLRLQLEVPERDAASIEANQTVRLTVEGDPDTHTGVITRLSPAIDEETRILRVEGDVQNPGTLRPGSFVRAEIVVDTHSPMVTIPPEAVQTFAGIEKAFVVTNSQSLERVITTGKKTPAGVEIVAGLNAGETVILEPGGMRSGQPVIVR